MKLRKISKESIIQNLDYYLLIVRWSVIFASAIIYFLAKPERKMLLPPLVVLLVLIGFNLPVTAYIWRYKPFKKKHFMWILILDIIQGSFAVAVTGGYDSMFFVIYLLSISEAGVCFNWQVATAWIVSIDGIQVATTTLHRVAMGSNVSTYALVSRFVRLLIVGLILIMLGEILRREEKTRRNAMLSSAHLKILNDIFGKLGGASFDKERIFDIILSSVELVGNVEYSLVLFKEDDKKDVWEIEATSRPDMYIKGYKISNLRCDNSNDFLFRRHVYDTDIDPFFFRGNTDEAIVIRLAAYDEKNKELLIIGRKKGASVIEDEKFFLKTLALEARLALHNTFLFIEKQKQIKRLDKFKEIQTTFFSAAGHELKTPLTVLKTLLATLELTIKEPSGDQKEIFSTLKGNVNRLDNLISDILDTARLESVDIKLNKKPVDMAKVIERIIAAMQPLASGRKQDIIFKKRSLGSSRILIYGDVKRVSEIVSNLLSNALKFSPPESSVNITIWKKADYAAVCIYDEGPIIPEPQQKKIFDKYYTASGNKALTGFGLGLYIVKQLVILHGGEIWISERQGKKGFCFTIPLYREV